jgi:squalene monooxygenase
MYTQRVRSVPCRTLAVETVRRLGVHTIGDALNMRHPLTGGGMTVALTDAALLATLLRPVPSLHDLDAVQQAIDAFFAARSNTASTINILAQILFDVFCGGSVQPALAPVRDACFAYFPYFGTDCLGLVSGLTPSPPRLVAHFFAVAAFAVYQLLFPVPTPRRLWDAGRAFIASYKVIEGPLLQHFVKPHHVPYDHLGDAARVHRG